MTVSAKKKKPAPYANPYAAGALLGVVLFTSFFLTGSGLGASGALQRYVAAIQDFFSPTSVNTNSYLLKYAGGNIEPLDNWLVYMSIGIVLGGFVSAWIHGRLSFTTGKGPRISVRTRWLMAFLGGIIMGYGARFARGCTSGQGLSGGTVLSVGSWAFLLAVFAGAYAVAYFFRRLWI